MGGPRPFSPRCRRSAHVSAAVPSHGGSREGRRTGPSRRSGGCWGRPSPLPASLQPQRERPCGPSSRPCRRPPRLGDAGWGGEGPAPPSAGDPRGAARVPRAQAGPRRGAAAPSTVEAPRLQRPRPRPGPRPEPPPPPPPDLAGAACGDRGAGRARVPAPWKQRGNMSPKPAGTQSLRGGGGVSVPADRTPSETSFRSRRAKKGISKDATRRGTTIPPQSSEHTRPSRHSSGPRRKRGTRSCPPCPGLCPPSHPASAGGSRGAAAAANSSPLLWHRPS